MSKSCTTEDLKKLHRVFKSFLITKTIPSLSTILKEPIEHNLSRIREIELADLEKMIPFLEDIIAMSAVYVKSDGDLRLGILLYLPEKDSKKLAAKLLGKAKLNKLSSIGRSSISEVGNILSASIFNAVSHNSGFKVESSVPGFVIDTFRTLIESVAAEIGEGSDNLIVANVLLRGRYSGTKLRVLLIQDSVDARKLISNY